MKTQQEFLLEFGMNFNILGRQQNILISEEKDLIEKT